MNLFKFIFRLFFALFTLHSMHLNAQSAGEYRSNAVVMNWESAANWQVWDAGSSSWITAIHAPTSGDSAITILQGHTVSITTAMSCDQLIVNGTLKNAGTTFTINDGPGDDLTVNIGGKLVNEATGASIINLGKFSMKDSVINKTSCTFINKGLIVNEKSFFKNNGILINASTSVILNSGDFLTGGSISFEDGSVYQHNFSSEQPTAGTIPTASWKKGSVCEILACGNAFQPGALNQVFHHFIWNNSTQPHDFNLIANPNSVTGNFEIKNTNEKKLAYKGGSSGDLTVADSFKITKGTFVLTNGTASTTVKASTYVQTGGTLDLSSSSATATILITSFFTHTGGNIQRSGTSALNAITINGASPSQIESTGFRTGDLVAFTINKDGAGGSCTIAAGKTFLLNSGTSFNLLDNTSAPIDLLINGTFTATAATWNLTHGNTIINGTFIHNAVSPVAANSTINTLRFNANSIYRHASDGNEFITASWDRSSTAVITGITRTTALKNSGQLFGNIRWSANKQEQPCVFGEQGFGVQGDFTIESTGKESVRFPDCDFTIAGNLAVQQDSKLQLAAGEGLYDPLVRTITIMGNVSVSQTAMLQTGSSNTTSTSHSTFNQHRSYNLHLKKDFMYTSGTPIISYDHRSFPGTATHEEYRLQLTFDGDTLQHVVMNKQTSGMIELSANEYIAANFYDLLISGKGTHLIPQLYDLKVHSIVVDANDTLTSGLEDINIVQYAALTDDGAVAAPFCNVYGALDLGMNTVADDHANGSFQVYAGGLLKTKHPQGIDSSAATGCIQTSGKRVFASGAHYIYNGNSNQVTGTGLPLLISGSLTISNSTLPVYGGVALTNNTRISGALYLDNGKLITTASSALTIDYTGVVFPAGGQSNSFVDGPIKKTGLHAGDEFIFPTGNKNKWARIGITPKNIGSTADYTAAYEMENPSATGTIKLGNGLDHISTAEYWKLDQTDNGDSATIKLYWQSGSFSGIYSTTPSDLTIAHNEQAITDTWTSETGNLLATGNPATGTLQATVSLVPFNKFTFGSATSINPLPVELLSFYGNPTSKGNALNWITASENNNRCFLVQRSSTGDQFSQIGIVKGQEHSIHLLRYAFVDSTSLNTPFYYRLKQVNEDGTYTYSSIIRMEGLETQDIIAYPNPAATGSIHITGSANIQSVSIYNVLGKKVFEEHPGTEQTEQLFNPDASGIYILKAITLDGNIITKRLIKS